MENNNMESKTELKKSTMKSPENKFINRTNKKVQSWLNFGALLLVVLIANLLGNVYYQRFDLTEEKRYTLSNTSIKLAKSLKDKLYFKLYLDGEMSARFKRLKLEIRDLAYEFREASGNKIEIEIVDPFKGASENDLNEILQSYADKGIEPVRDVDRENMDETRIKYLLPGAEMLYIDKTTSVNFFEYDVALSPDENISRAIDNIEYEIANGLRQIASEKNKRIVVADGSSEMVDAQVQSFAMELSKYYQISALNMNFSDPECARPFEQKIAENPDKAEMVLIDGLHRRLNLNDLLIIIKPLKDYSYQELYLIDQFLMKGGKVMWLVDPVHMEIDSFRSSKENLGITYNLENIQATLLHYGVNLKNTFLMDLNCNRIPIPASGRMELVEFPYFPLFIEPPTSHIINKNMGSVWAQFPGTLEPKVRPNLDIIPILASTPYTKVITTPATIDLEQVYMQMRDEKFRSSLNQGIQISGVLMEGNFRSRYQYMQKYNGSNHLDSGKSKMIVIADGDIMRNPVGSRGVPFPTGYDRINQFTFANKKFLLNCIDYLIDDNGLIEIRSKERTLRLLDPEKAKSERSYWQYLSLILPLMLIMLFGAINHWVRLRKYTR